MFWIEADISNGKIDVSYSGYTEDISFVISEITEYANKIYHEIQGFEENISNTKEDYVKLFLLCAKIARQAREVSMTDFGIVADDLHNTFHNYIIHMQNKNIFNDVELLKSVVKSLKKIWNIKKIFRKFKEALLNISVDTIDLSINEIGIIEDSIEKIQNWNKLYTSGMKIEISDKPDMFVQSANKIIKSTTEILDNAVSGLINKRH